VSIHRYLLDDEDCVVMVRRHPVVLVGHGLLFLVGLILLLWFRRHLPAIGLIHALIGLGICVLFGRTAWKVACWNADRFAVTTARAMLVTGLVNRQVSMVPLRKLTDMSLRRSPLGMVLDYGEFVIESAGEAQAMRRIRFLPHPDVLYLQLSELLFAAEGVFTSGEW